MAKKTGDKKDEMKKMMPWDKKAKGSKAKGKKKGAKY